MSAESESARKAVPVGITESKSIIAHLGSENFLRLKFGVGDKPKEMDLADYVLGRFSSQDEATVSEGIKRACEAVECMIGEGCDAAMNKYNG